MWAQIADLSAFGFSVDQTAVEPGPYRLTVNRLVGGVFTADSAAVRRLLPSPQLHPVRVLPGRTVVMVNCTDADHYIGSLPPFRTASMLVAAVATPGTRPGPWLTPILSDASTLKHRVGLVVLASVSTNRVASEFSRTVLGWPGLVADIRNEQDPRLERFIATDGGEPLIEVSIRPTGKPERWGPTFWTYGVRHDRVVGWRMDMSATTTQLRYGPGASHMALGDHPALAHLHDLGLRPRGVIGSFHTDGSRVIDTPPMSLGPAIAAPAPSASADFVQGHYVVARPDGSEATIDPGIDELGINPAGNFVAAPAEAGLPTG